MRKTIVAVLCVTAIAIPSAALAQASASDFTSATRYDLEGRVTGTIAPDPDGAGPLHHLATRNQYDPAGRLIRQETGELAAWLSEAVAPENWSSYTTFSIQQQIDTVYDGLDRKVKESLWSGGTLYQVTQYSYDTIGRLKCTAVRMNPAAFGSLPDACTLGTQGTQGPDRITRNEYDDAGQLLQVRKGVGTSLEQAYVTYAYTANGKQEYVIDANGNKAQLTYDGFDRQVGWYFPSTTPPSAFNPATVSSTYSTAGAVSSTDFEGYGYDANGNRTSLRKRDGRTFTYTYDALNRMTAKIVPDACVAGYACYPPLAVWGRDVYYSYDLRGLQTAARFDGPAGADAVTNAYDGFGRIASSSVSMNGVTRTLSYQHDANGNRTRVTHPDGAYFSYSYDGLDRSVAILENGNATVVATAYDAAGRRSSQTRGGVATSYGYDAVSRLTSLADDLAGTAADTTTTLSYNPASQIAQRTRSNASYAFNGFTGLNRSYTTNGLNQYSVAGPNAFTYDSLGNLTSDGTTTYAYDAESRLKAGLGKYAMAHDPLGRLYVMGAASTSTQFLYDGDELVAEYNGLDGTLLRRYVHGVGEDDPLLWYEGSSLADRRSLQSDHQGSVISVAEAGGNLIGINAYDEYGIPNGVLPGTTPNLGRFQYTGQIWLPEAGMYYYKARIYSPTLGRFLQTDPIGYNDQINLYAYVGNDPVNGRDTTGMFAAACGEGVICPMQEAPSAPTQTVIGGPLAGQQADPSDSSTFTQPGSPGWDLARAGAGGYYEPTANGIVFHSDAAALAKAGAIGVVTVLGGELIGPAVGAIRGLGLLSKGGGGGEIATTTVGRWMSPGEFSTMSQTGRVVEGAGGRTFVTNPANPGAYTSARPGSVFAEFIVPTSSLRPAGRSDWSVIPGPNVTTRIYGPAPAQMPTATCIVCRIGGN